MSVGRMLRENIVPAISVFVAIILLMAGIFVVKPYMELQEQENVQRLETQKQLALRGSRQLVETSAGRHVEMTAAERERYETRVLGRKAPASSPASGRSSQDRAVEEEFRPVEGALVLRPDSAARRDTYMPADDLDSSKNPFKPWFREEKIITGEKDDLDIHYRGFVERGNQRFAIILFRGEMKRIAENGLIPDTSLMIRNVYRDSVLIVDVRNQSQRRIGLAGGE